jgi:aminoglycoside 6'-N-acetyltransferase I
MDPQGKPVNSSTDHEQLDASGQKFNENLNMQISMTYRNYHEKDFQPLFAMNLKLYKNLDKAEVKKMLDQITHSEKHRIFVAEEKEARIVGFATVSIRTDYVEGAEQSPTGYLEAIFVEFDQRKCGIARKLIELGELWCKEKGCTQIGSDTWLDNPESQEFHLNMGFREEDRLVHFIKNIK